MPPCNLAAATALPGRIYATLAAKPSHSRAFMPRADGHARPLQLYKNSYLLFPKSGMIYLTHIYIQKGAIHFDYQ